MAGRSWADSPDIDGLVFFEGSCPPGEMTDVLIDSAEDGFLYGRGRGERPSFFIVGRSPTSRMKLRERSLRRML